MSMRWLLSALAAVAAMDPSANPNCYLVPILVISPHTPLPAMNCVNKPFPAGDCMKEVVRATLTTVDTIKTHGTEWNCLGDADHVEYASSVHYRGDSTLRLIKHQMAIKLDTPKSFLGLPADTPWSLHGPYFDASLLRNHVAHHIFRQTGPPKEALHAPSVDPCWVTVGSYGRMWWLTPTCSGFGWCAQGPGAKCQCTAGRKTFDCSPNPPSHLIAITASSEDSTAMSNPLVWAGAAAALTAVAVIIVIKRKRNPGYETL
ncbi:hypothetical protein SPRG_21761 [Saprolegnia parasitica CBS 223.65]|uniref:EGF-like domain-containing protein n=1 Tax=Saprolegnia parasitica (strain CBS 223.65) TaxID=695850 RepID=A0A067BIF5_SAPPC|nr:hypothetical protein SPRG_21761 [Saprolegnia parasitica CBS 223.65]KDO17958.1 hypothetical protein SPRG_21761 [Saprolegnia parasitica CBS 223.65]|eukprot:XP_012211335.1 hypothetical protein SPRG_21761 [Saprolegnia parasitica CBS 223.65]